MLLYFDYSRDLTLVLQIICELYVCGGKFVFLFPHIHSPAHPLSHTYPLSTHSLFHTAVEMGGPATIYKKLFSSKDKKQTPHDLNHVSILITTKRGRDYAVMQLSLFEY